MKLFTHWSKVESIQPIGGVNATLTAYGGSNLSLEDAEKQGKIKIDKILKKIAGDRHAFDDYEVPIREEILSRLDAQNIVTRNLYGAEVLNSESLIFLDIDEAKKSLFSFFSKSGSQKERILAMVRKKAASPAHSRLGFHIYETAKGVHVIVTGVSHAGSSNEGQALLREFECDELYRKLCKKQNCYRARLTPKPHRLKLPKIRAKVPRTASETSTLEQWIHKYNQASTGFATCKYLEAVGMTTRNPIIDFHDQRTRAKSGLPVA
jgi:hypothetical protein